MRAVVLTGEPGIGKTALWEAGIAAARELGLRALVARPADTEARLSFVTLGDLLADVDEEALAGVPGPQRRALEVALLRVEPEGPPPTTRAIVVGLPGRVARARGSRASARRRR